MAAPTDRYEPLPSLVGLPGHFLRKLSPRGRRIAIGIAVLLLAGGVAGAIALAPRISEAKREHAAAERAARVRAAKQARAQLIVEQRPRHGRARDAQVASVEQAITRDARARAADGEVQNPARRTACRRLGRESGRLLLACTAITTERAATENASGVIVGYSYRAAISPDSGRFAFCKTSGRPPLGFAASGLPEVELPRVCGG